MSTRRSYGTGSLRIVADSTGREAWFGKWRSNGRQINRRLGDRRTTGRRDGLTRAQAEAELRRLMAETAAMPARGEALTISELGRRYQADQERRGLKGATLIAFESALRVHLEPFFAGKSIADVRKQDVRDLVAVLAGKGLSAKTIGNYIGALHGLYAFAIREEWATVNPCANVKLPAVARSTEIRWLDPDEVEALLAGASTDFDRALYLAAVMTGLRQGELIALRWRDVDFAAGRVRVQRTYSNKRTRDGELVGFTLPKSRRSKRSVPLADRVAGALDRLYKESRWQDDDDLVFADPQTGGPLEAAAVLRAYRRALKAGRLDETRRFHDLRHTFGTRMASAGTPIRTLQEWMGHADMATTQIYADYAPSPHEAALVEAAFGASASREVEVAQ